MRDWRRLVAEKLEGADLTAVQKEEVAAELAGHLEDVCEGLRGEGMTEDDAVAAALSEVADWRELGRRVARAKRKETAMNDRTRRFWLPALASLGAAVILQAALVYVSLRSDVILHSSNARWLYAAWLIAQVACGAIGAYLSRRAGGRRLTRVAAALTTSTVMMTVILIVVGFSVVMHATGIWAGSAMEMKVFLRVLGSIVFLPAAALFLGALPFLPERKGAIAG